MTKAIKKFLNPHTIAVIGASNTPDKVGNILMKKLENFDGRVIPVNSKHEIVENKLAYKKIKDIKETVNLAIIATPAKSIPLILEELGKKGIHNIIIISSGFEEIGNIKLQTKLNQIKNKYKLNILGPNCFGIFNAKLNLDTTFAKTTPKKGTTAVISQSGALWSYMADLDKTFSYFISLGNMSGLSFTDFLEFLDADPKTKKIICYVEKLKQGKKFIEICKNSKKEIIVIKTGKTKKGKEAAISHTASLATNYKVYSGAFKQAKIKHLNSITEALNLEKENLISKLKGKKIAILTNAGGAGALLADNLASKDFKIFGPKDLLGTAKPIDYARTLHRIKGHYDNIIVILTPQSMSDPANTARELVISHHRNKIIAVFLGNKSMKAAKQILEKNNIPFFSRAV